MTSDELADFAQVVRRHVHAEARGDTDEALATVCDDPYYTFDPLGWVIDSKELLREFYDAFHEAMAPMRARWTPEEREQMENMFGPDDPWVFTGPSGYLSWRQDVPSVIAGDPTTRSLSVVIARDEASGLIKGEFAYGDKGMAATYSQFVSPDLARRMKMRRDAQTD